MVVSVYEVIINYFRIKKDKVIKQVYDTGLLEFCPTCLHLSFVTGQNISWMGGFQM